MFAALIFVLSGAMLAQFVVFFWRANMLAVGAQPVSDLLRSAELSFANALNQNGFSTMTAMSRICPNLGSPSSLQLGRVRSYYRAMRSVAYLCKAVLPQASAWARREMASCTKYVAVSMDLRLQSNQEFVAELRSY
ncbi:MAG TPA: hypothetical protein VGR94_08840 [Candidatus Acidoferrales bacterium]|nr:hypothetical protein [Candidatus Acidoferrales bacterium]